MLGLYRLQTRLGLTGPEGTAALVLVLALFGGLVAQRWQASQTPVAPDFYAAGDAAFVAASQAAPGEAPDSEEPSGAAGSGAVGFAALPAAGAGQASTPDALAEADAAVEEGAAQRGGAKPPPVRTNLNTATAVDLQRLPRIGPALAERILEYRRTHGGFRSTAELDEVEGIGERTMDLLAPWVFV